MVSEEEIVPGFAIDDGAALHFVDGVATRVASGRTGADVYWVERMGGGEATSTAIGGVERVGVYEGSEARG
jgi:hypothetical protein